MSSPSDPFDGTEEHYASHRPGYGAAAIQYLAERFDVAGSRVLDLGCGTGQIAIPIAAHADDVVGMDPSDAMLSKARERARAAGQDNVEWVHGSDADLDESLGTFRLVTMGRAFHRMDQPRTLERLQALVRAGGGVATLGDPEWLTRGTREWQAAVYDVAERYLELPERTGPVEYEDPWDEMLVEFGYADVEVATFQFEREWDPEAVVGYVLSLSFCSPRKLGEDQDAFVADLRERLAEYRGPFRQTGAVRVISGRVEP